MIPLKKCNYITGDTTSVSYGVNKILKFLDLAGRNILLLTRSRSNSDTSLKYLFNNKIEFSQLIDFESILSDSGNLFRVDLIVVDLFNVRATYISSYKDILDKIGIDHIILAKQYHYKESDDVTDYHILRESSGYSGGQVNAFTIGKDKYTITDKVRNWSADLDDLAKSFIRDKRIDGIIGEE